MAAPLNSRERLIVSSAPRSPWQPDSWQQKPAIQQPKYPDDDALKQALETLVALPPLVTSWEIQALREQLAAAERGEVFVLQGGDCAESFSDCSPSIITNRLKVLLQMSLVLVQGLQKPVLRVGRFAGQYAKPRSADMETRDGVSLPSYRGDVVNAPDFTEAARTPDPQRMLEAHTRSAMTMNFVRGLIDGGFADLHHPEYWNLDWVQHSPMEAEYRQLLASIGRSVRFMESLAGGTLGDLNRVDFYTSHEALLLYYEQAQTRQVPRHSGWFNLSTHMPWIGVRTADPAGAHIEYCRGIENPVGLKVGPNTPADELQANCRLLNPNNQAGRLVLIHRMGADQVHERLPAQIKAVQATGIRHLWMADPMHGNTRTTASGIKTRDFDEVLAEIEAAVGIHQALGSHLGGVHLELTGEPVTECVGGARQLGEEDLHRDYRTTVDPRLNYEQSLELAMKLAALQQA